MRVLKLNTLYIIIFFNLFLSNFSFAQGDCATLNAPANGSTIASNSSVTLTWARPTDDTDFYRYRVYVGTNAAADNIVDGFETAATSYNLTGLTCNTTYNWRIETRFRGWFIVYYYWSGNCSTINSFTTPPGPGNPNSFGTNQWTAYCYSDNNFTNYTGYYPAENTLNFSSSSKFAATSSPSVASGYVGCSVPADNHSIRYKRQGFPVGNYRIDIPNHDDEYGLYINGSLISSHNGFGDVHNGVWTGNLNASSTVELRWREFTGNSIGALNIVAITAPALVPGAIGTNQTICSGDDPLPLTSTTEYSGGCYFTGYQWQSSTNGTTYTDINGATTATYDPPAGLTQSTYYRRKATDACNQLQFTVPVIVTVTTTPPGDPSIFGSNIWNAYVYKDNNFASYGGYYTESALSFDSQAKWNNLLSPSTPTSVALGYLGCQIPVDNHSIKYMRRGSPQILIDLALPAMMIMSHS